VVASRAVRAFVPGIYPRSESLIQATRDLDRGRTTPEAVAEQVERDRAAFLVVQREAGMDLLADGMLRWQDLFRPLVEAAEGLATGPLTRFLDTNTFYRSPQATPSELRLREPLAEQYVMPLPGPRLVTLPSPWAFARGTGLKPRDIAERVLKPQIDALGSVVELIVLVEPFLARDDHADLSELAEALTVLGGGPELALHLVFSDARGLFEAGLAQLPVDGLGVDFFLTRADAVPTGLDKLLLAGVVDARSSLVEDPLEVARFAAGLGSERVALVPNGDLQFVAEPIAREKVARLGRAAVIEIEEAA
jgi:5-methyltetrahydropteroyltriglutamate--homocysteine methyltransferase